MTSIEKRLAEIRKRLEAASPAPSVYEASPYAYNGQIIFQARKDDAPAIVSSVEQHHKGYGPFIFHSWSDISFLLSTLETAMGALEEAKEGLASSLETIDSCIEFKHIPTTQEALSCKSYLDVARRALAQIEAQAKGDE